MEDLEKLEDLSRLLSNSEFIDLSPFIENGMPRWLTHPHVVVHKTVVHEHDGYYTQTLNIAEHTGSHIDAPAHIHQSMLDSTIDKVAPETFLRPATLLDVRKYDLAPGQFATKKMLQEVEAKLPRKIQKGDVVLVNFGWFERYWVTDQNWAYYSSNCPGIDREGVEWISSFEPTAVGADTVAFDTALINGKEVDVSHAHLTYCLPKHIYIIECLSNLNKVPSNFYFMALPLKIKDGSGSPIRAIAVV